MPLSLLNRSELASFAQRTRIPTLPAALASVPFGFVLVRVRVSNGEDDSELEMLAAEDF